jgi:hypothetical protein
VLSHCLKFLAKQEAEIVVCNESFVYLFVRILCLLIALNFLPNKKLKLLFVMNLLFVCKNLIALNYAKQEAEIGVRNASFALSSPSFPCQTNKLKLLIVRAFAFLLASVPHQTKVRIVKCVYRIYLPSHCLQFLARQEVEIVDCQLQDLSL